jgi:hypothetical protein
MIPLGCLSFLDRTNAPTPRLVSRAPRQRMGRTRLALCHALAPHASCQRTGRMRLPPRLVPPTVPRSICLSTVGDLVLRA